MERTTPFPIIPGHENLGIVEAIGPGGALAHDRDGCAGRRQGGSGTEPRPLVSAECAQDALQLYRDNRGAHRTIVAVIYTHSHVDHYGGVQALDTLVSFLVDFNSDFALTTP